MWTLLLIAVLIGLMILGMPGYQDAEAAKKEAQAKIVCPHCQTAGRVTAMPGKYKKGVSGGKATAAILTGGVSMLATGLSRKETGTKMTCGNCRVQWFA